MHLAANVLDCVVNNFMRVISFQSVIGLEGVTVERGPGLHMLFDFCLNGFLFPAGNDGSAYSAVIDFIITRVAALKDSHYGSLIFRAASGDAPSFDIYVHVPGFAADEFLIRFALTGKFLTVTHAQRETNSVVPEPCGLLSDADDAMNFPRTDSVLAIHDLPHSRQPSVQAYWRVLKDRAGFQCELRRVMLLATVPAVVFF